MSGKNSVMRIPVPLPYDAEVEYLESTGDGSQFFKLDKLGSIRVVIDAQAEKVEDGVVSVAFGIDQITTGSYFGIVDTETALWGIGSKEGMYIKYPLPTSRVIADIIFEIKSQYGTIDGKDVSCENKIDFNEWYIFGLGKSNFFIGKIYGIKIYNGQQFDNLFADLIPVRIGQVGYLYDKISGIMHKNRGEKDFILGKDKI